MNTKQLILTLFSLSLILTFMLTAFPPVYANNWLTGYVHRKSHVINHASGSGTNYQVCFKIYKGIGTDGTESLVGVTAGKMYCNNHVRNDFGDVRFTQSDGSTEYNYWMETLSSGTYAIFWVKITEDLSSNDVTMYVYYNKSDATTTSNGANTFITFNSFETGVEGWYGDSGTTVSQSNDYAYQGTYSLKIQRTTNSRGARKAITSTQNQRFLIYCKSVSSISNSLMYLYNSGGATVGYHYFDIATEWARHIVQFTDSGSSSQAGTMDGTAITWLTQNNVDRIFIPYDATGITAYNDVFCLCKYVKTEPSHGTWGVQEPLYQITYYFNIGGTFRVNGTTVSNGSSNYPTTDLIELVGIPTNASYYWKSFNWSTTSSTTNIYVYHITGNMTIWCYFGTTNSFYNAGYSAGYSAGYNAGYGATQKIHKLDIYPPLLFGGFCVLIVMVFIVKKRGS